MTDNNKKQLSGVTYKTILIFLIGFVAGGYAQHAFTKEVASQVADIKTLQTAGYIPPFEVDSVEPTRWSE